MSELRQDLISGDWVVIAPGRAARPDSFASKKTPRIPAPKRGCPFEDPAKSGNAIITAYPNERAWQVVVVPNKYPALSHAETCAVPFTHGIYRAMTGVGDQELIITRDHNTSFAALTPARATELFRIFQARHRIAAKDPCLVYATTFMNYGPTVGSSVWHPHYQFTALPFTPPHARHSLRGSEEYFKKSHRCARCEMLVQERKEKKRIIAENGSAVAFAPYASKRPFEVAIVPKRHQSRFTDAPEGTLTAAAALLQTVLQRMKRYAGDPDLNFFIHDAPTDGNAYPHHHWHIEVMPSISRLGGLEFSTGIYINVAEPEMAAVVLRGEKLA
ncbi:MAG TPA: HIT domain-containing protein [Candidatus Paceibacterota bacterium]|jgi:UDPglucose--hexose-1-phosphate uridylyltransferase|nr:HIT domain-containing protein [Candidatus Paceibacterota bacterium]